MRFGLLLSWDHRLEEFSLSHVEPRAGTGPGASRPGSLRILKIMNNHELQGWRAFHKGKRWREEKFKWFKFQGKRGKNPQELALIPESAFSLNTEYWYQTSLSSGFQLLDIQLACYIFVALCYIQGGENNNIPLFRLLNKDACHNEGLAYAMHACFSKWPWGLKPAVPKWPNLLDHS